jgi:hypothetical protein
VSVLKYIVKQLYTGVGVTVGVAVGVRVGVGVGVRVFDGVGEGSIQSKEPVTKPVT